MILTERDKKLLYTLAVIAILVVGVYLLVLPAYKGNAELRQQLDTANAEFDRRQAVIAAVDVTQASIVELQQKLYSEAAGYPSVMHNLDLDRLHTLRAVMQQWEPTKLELAQLAPFEVKRFGVEVAADGEMVEQSASSAWLAASGVSMSANARHSDAVTLIDTIVTSPDEQLESLKITPMELEATLGEDGNTAVTVNSDNPYLTIEMVTRQCYKLNQQAPELVLPSTSVQ